MEKDSLYIVMPAYNEEGNIRAVVEEWYPVLQGKAESSRLVVADSGSTDSTHTILVDLKKQYSQLEILSDTDRYYGPKLIALYRYAVACGGGCRYIFQTDSDGQTNPAEFDAFWQMRNEYDAIFGYRKVRGDGKFRSFAEKVVCFLLRVYFGVKVPDANAPFRLMKTDVVAKYVKRFEDDYDLPNIMLVALFSFYKEKIAFKEISFKPRLLGDSCNHLPQLVRSGWKALGDFYAFRKSMMK